MKKMFKNLVIYKCPHGCGYETDQKYKLYNHTRTCDKKPKAKQYTLNGDFLKYV